jgi:hypothetical protein
MFNFSNFWQQMALEPELHEISLLAAVIDRNAEKYPAPEYVFHSNDVLPTAIFIINDTICSGAESLVSEP